MRDMRRKISGTAAVLALLSTSPVSSVMFLRSARIPCPRAAVVPDKPLRACLKIPRGAVFEPRAGGEWCRSSAATRENTLHGSSTEEQRSQPALCSKTLRAAGLLPVGRVGSVVTAHYGDAPPSPPCPQPKSLAAAPLAIFRQALNIGRSTRYC